MKTTFLLFTAHVGGMLTLDKSSIMLRLLKLIISSSPKDLKIINHAFHLAKLPQLQEKKGVPCMTI